MKKILFIILSLMTSLAIHAQDITGSWQGELDLGGQKLGIVFKFSKNAEGANIVKMDVPEQGAMDIPVDISYLQKDSLNLNVPKIGMNYSGKMEGEVIKKEHSDKTA
jgi:hypothetical protein